MVLVNLADWVEFTEVQGPGRRFALWTQGCLKRCSGCCNPHMLDLVPRTIIEVSELIQLIRDAKKKHQIEGVTFAGGEPMLQARGLAAIAREVRTDGLSVMTFTGYLVEELPTLGLAGAIDLIDVSDIVVDGPYRSDLRETRRNWAGSTNQRFHFLTDRYAPGIEYDPAFPHGFEIRFGMNTFHTNGCATNISVV